MLIANNTDINLGDVKPNIVKEFEFEVQNNSEHLTSVMLSVSCGCTVPSVIPNPIPAGASAKVTAKFDTTGKSGFQRKNIYIDYMEGNSKMRLTITFRANVV